MKAYFEVNFGKEVIYTSDFISGIYNNKDKNEFEDLFNIDNLEDFKKYSRNEEFVQCTFEMLRTKFSRMDLDELEIFFTFCTDDGILCYSLVFNGDECSTIDWKKDGYTFKVIE